MPAQDWNSWCNLVKANLPNLTPLLHDIYILMHPGPEVRDKKNKCNQDFVCAFRLYSLAWECRFNGSKFEANFRNILQFNRAVDFLRRDGATWTLFENNVFHVRGFLSPWQSGISKEQVQAVLTASNYRLLGASFPWTPISPSVDDDNSPNNPTSSIPVLNGDRRFEAFGENLTEQIRAQSNGVNLRDGSTITLVPQFKGITTNQPGEIVTRARLP